MVADLVNGATYECSLVGVGEVDKVTTGSEPVDCNRQQTRRTVAVAGAEESIVERDADLSGARVDGKYTPINRVGTEKSMGVVGNES